MNEPGDPATALDAPYDRLKALPRALWLPALVAAVGDREQRLVDAHTWLDALQSGRLPPHRAHFGDAPATAALRAVVGELNLPAFTRDAPALAQQVIRTLLWHLDHALDLQPRLSRGEAIAQVADEFRAAWTLETQGLEADLALLRDLSGGAHLHWDELRGRLRSRQWHTARRAAERIGQLPEIGALLQRLGRRDWSARTAPAPSPRHQAPERVSLRAVTTRLPGAPGEITGIRFDSRLEHMLPGEALLLRHPVGQRLWRARQAEGRLLSHETEALVVDHRPDPQGRARDRGAAPESATLERGPFVLCLDTSGSMAGGPENIAKAVAIAALREAHAQQRGCRLLAFGGAGELVEHDLGAASGGLAATLDLMGQAFDGGTDVQTPIERALDVIDSAAWRGADLLIVSDGEFGCVRATLDKLDRARDRLGLHVAGVLVGDRETMGLLEVCDEICWLRDWRRHADGDDATRGTSPVHSKSLTALYFPNALSRRAARHRPSA